MNTPKIKYEKFPVKLTDAAISTALMAIEAQKSEQGDLFRISVNGGGCSGLKYALNIVNNTDAYDIVCTEKKLNMVIDIFSLCFLRDTVIDYKETIEGAGFKFLNPNAKKTCGCGSSFS